MEYNEHSAQYASQIMQEYKKDINMLKPYVDYLERLEAKDASHQFTGEGIGGNSVPVPVFDANLLAFVKKAAASGLMDRNYPYVYSRYGLRTHADEYRAIENATYKEVHILKGIISYYCLKGMVKGSYWVEGVETGIFCRVIRKFEELIDMWK